MTSTRTLGDREIDRVAEVDDSEEGSLVLEQHGSTTVPRAETWRRRRTGPDGWAQHIATWMTFAAADRIAIGAFEGDRLIGIAVTRLRLDPDTAQLAALFVDRAHRRQGVATALAQAADTAARSSGAAALYVSALPSEAAVAFYRSCGFVPTTTPNPELLAIEPEDIHMIKALGRPAGETR